MKKLRNLIVAVLLASMASCTSSYEENGEPQINEESQSPVQSLEERTMAMPNNTFTDNQTVTAYAEVMKEVLAMAKDEGFRNYVYESSQQQSDLGDDYLVYLDDMTNKLGKSEKFGKSSSKLMALTAKIQETDKEARPMVFFPKAETIEDNVKTNKNYEVAKNLNEPLAVLKGAHNADYSVPAYRLDSERKLVYVRDVDEEYAWNNDVYVIGAAERLSYCPPTDDCWDFDSGGSGSGGGSGSSYNPNTRKDGRVEMGGQIQVLALNEIEHWTAGKLEFRMIVSGLRNSGGTVVNDIKFPKIKRKNFKDRKWYDYNVFLFNWNLTTLADYNIEKWLERDNGWSESTIEISIPGTAGKPATSTTPAQPALPGAKVNIKYKRGDEELGTALIQFSDKVSQVYNLGQANIRRK